MRAAPIEEIEREMFSKAALFFRPCCLVELQWSRVVLLPLLPVSSRADVSLRFRDQTKAAQSVRRASSCTTSDTHTLYLDPPGELCKFFFSFFQWTFLLVGIQKKALQRYFALIAHPLLLHSRHIFLELSPPWGPYSCFSLGWWRSWFINRTTRSPPCDPKRVGAQKI